MVGSSSAPISTILLVASSRALIRTLRSAVDSLGDFQLEVYCDPDKALAKLAGADVILIVLEVGPGTDGEDSQAALRLVSQSYVPVIAVSSCDHDTDYLRPKVLGAGAAEYLELPADLGRLQKLIHAAALRLPSGMVTSPGVWKKANHKLAFDPFSLVPGMEEMTEQLHRVVPQDTTILLTGETGTGKTRLARLIHELSPRCDEPFLVVDCGAVSPSLIESEMFGHVQGAFTGADQDRLGKLAAAGHGTLLLDEVNSLPLPLQAKLLRAVDDRVFEPVGSEKALPLRARLIAATNAALDGEVTAGRFRAELYFRINVVGFYLPPLRDRRAVIAPLACKLLVELAARNRPDVRGLAPEALKALQDYPWPGNIRELRNVIERAVALCPGPDVMLSDLPEVVRNASVAPTAVALTARTKPSLRSNAATLTEIRAEAELLRINEALLKHRNNRCRAAAELGISRMALYNKLHKYGLIRPSYQTDDVG